MKMYKATVYVMDVNEDVPPLECLQYMLNRDRYITGKLFDARVCDIGEWHDDHPLNFTTATHDMYNSYFEEPKDTSIDYAEIGKALEWAFNELDDFTAYNELDMESFWYEQCFGCVDDILKAYREAVK